jgi:hypothetical protein
MQVGVYPRTLRAFVLLSRFVGSGPIAFGIPPESGESECKSCWRVGRSKRLAKIFQGHFEFHVTECQATGFVSLSSKHYQILPVIRSAHRDFYLQELITGVRGGGLNAPHLGSKNSAEKE